MTLLTTISEIEYAGGAGQDTFAYTFRVDKQTDMNVEIDGAPVAQGDFTMTGLGSAVGGTVILNTPLPVPATVLLFRQVPETQEVDYQPFDAFPSETHEGALDKLTMLVQQISASVLRSLRFPVGDNADPILPDKATRLNKFLGFDSNGDATVLSGTTGDPNSVQKPLGAVVAGNLMEFDATKDAVDSGSSLASLKAEIYNAIYPVGSFKIGVDPTPVVGGTWAQLPEGTFLMNTIAGADVAGGANVTNLVIGQMPNHNHGGGDHVHSMNTDNDGFGTGGQPNPVIGAGAADVNTNLSGDVINPEGNADDIENRPVYKGVAIWERTA